MYPAHVKRGRNASVFGMISHLGVRIVYNDLNSPTGERAVAQRKSSPRSRQPRPRKPQPTVDELFPAVAEWVHTTGWIEIGDQEGFGFIVRALDYGGLVFESQGPKTLGEALAALEQALADDLKRR
jgi:hypothetical protein